MTQSWTKTVTTKNEDNYISQKIYKRYYNGYVYLEKNIMNFKFIYDM